MIATSGALASCTTGTGPSSRHEATASGRISTATASRGATIEPSGYATILFAPAARPDRATAAVPVPPPPPAHDPALSMTPESIAGRESMMNPDAAASRAAAILDGRFSAAERGNYVGRRIVRDPKPHFAFQFRRDAAATLARYTRDPRFTAREGGLPPAELQPIMDAWWKRFEPYRLVGGAGVYEFDGVVRFDLNVDEAEFREIAGRERWVLPDRLELHFSRPRNANAIDATLRPYVRLFARQDREPAVINQARLGGRIILRDGCFRLVEHGGEGEPLVIFGRDAELSRDADNYMVVKGSEPKRTAPRIGEMMAWSGPRGVAEADAAIAALRAACGSGPIVAVGEPMSGGRDRP